jgi:hypothetical protein
MPTRKHVPISPASLPRFITRAWLWLMRHAWVLVFGGPEAERGLRAMRRTIARIIVLRAAHRFPKRKRKIEGRVSAPPGFQATRAPLRSARLPRFRGPQALARPACARPRPMARRAVRRAAGHRRLDRPRRQTPRTAPDAALSHPPRAPARARLRHTRARARALVRRHVVRVTHTHAAACAILSRWPECVCVTPPARAALKPASARAPARA